MEDSRFPLHRLPKNARVNVVKSMGILEILQYSLCTEATGSLVESLNWNVESIRVAFSREASIEIRFTNITALNIIFYRKEPLDPEEARQIPKLILLRTPEPVLVEYGFINEDDNLQIEGRQRRRWMFSKKEGLSFGDWRRHITWIFDNDKMHDIHFMPGSEKFYLKDIKRHLEDFPEEAFLCVDDDCSNEYHERVHRMFQPIPSLQLRRNPYDKCKLRRLICQNFEALSLEDNNPYTLDDLLLSNSLTIETHTPSNLSVKDIRRFIKHWMTGKTSRRTFYIEIELGFGIVMSAETVLRGIEHTIAEQGRERRYRNFLDDVIIPGGYDVRARDGNLATIVFGLSEIGNSEMKIYIW